ncbi:MAG: hypothetical protein AB7O57_18895 [Hyphomicrobiaceae bacterium]
MDQPTQPRGDFVAFMNRDKQPGDNRPAFEGRIAKPGTEEKREMALWAHQYADARTGEIRIMFNGSVDAVDAAASAVDQLTALVATAPEGAAEQSLNNLSLKPRQIVLFPNGFKGDAPDKDRPDYWGAYNPGDGSALVRISTWLKKDRNGRAFMSGATQYPLPGKSEAEMQRADARDGLEELVGRGDVTKGMPDKKRKGGRGE